MTKFEKCPHATIIAAFLCAAITLTAHAVDAPSSVPVEPDHCIALIWSSGGYLDLAAMLDSSCAPIADKIYFTANGSECANKRLAFDNFCPGSLKPDIYYVTIRHRDMSDVLDAMWVVVNSPVAQSEFNTWASDNADTSWTASLPRPYSSIVVSNKIPVDPEPPINGKPGAWDAPRRIEPGSFLHHNAVFEMRTTLSGEHGNQATYDKNGNLIRSTIAAGTADYYGPYNSGGAARWSTKHRDSDVLPFIRALQLDGNPVRILGAVGVPTRISRQCLHQGQYTEKYLGRRPIILP